MSDVIIQNYFLNNVSADWTLFLDRDGVINHRIVDGYVRTKEEFVLLDKVVPAIRRLRTVFGRIIVVTNQQGIGKGLMSAEDVEKIHQYMIEQLDHAIDKVYFAPNLATENSPLRKPNTGMALMAKKDFPMIRFAQSVMVGDSISDMIFGNSAGMKTVFLTKEQNRIPVDMYAPDLYAFARCFG
jgi:histidinol-phosphate phosphatase family protein